MKEAKSSRDEVLLSLSVKRLRIYVKVMPIDDSQTSFVIQVIYSTTHLGIVKEVGFLIPLPIRLRIECLSLDFITYYYSSSGLPFRFAYGESEGAGRHQRRLRHLARRLFFFILSFLLHNSRVRIYLYSFISPS